MCSMFTELPNSSWIRLWSVQMDSITFCCFTKMFPISAVTTLTIVVMSSLKRSENRFLRETAFLSSWDTCWVMLFTWSVYVCTMRIKKNVLNNICEISSWFAQHHVYSRSQPSYKKFKEEPGVFVDVLSADSSADHHLKSQLLMEQLQRQMDLLIRKHNLCWNDRHLRQWSGKSTFLFVGRVLELCEVLETFPAVEMRLPGRFKPWWKPKMWEQ